MKNVFKSLYSLFLFPLLAVAAPYDDYCGGGDYYYADSYYAIVDQFKLVDSQYHAFLNCPDAPFCASIEDATDGNIADWAGYFDKTFSVGELQELIYSKSLKWYVGLENGGDGSTLSRKLTNKKHSYFIKYMQLAKKAEGSSSDQGGSYGWYQGEDAQVVNKAEVLHEALVLLNNAPDGFLRNRIAFQAIRAAHYLQRNEQAIRTFNSYVVLDKKAPYMYYRALEQVSGAHFNKQHIDQAINGYLQVFTNLPERRQSNTLSLTKTFNLIQDGQLTPTISDPAIQEAYLFFTNYTNRDLNLDGMRQLAALNPNSPYLQVLATRYLDKVQAQLFSSDTYDYYDNNFAQLEELHNFTTGILKDKRLVDKDRYRLLLGLVGIMDANPNYYKPLTEIPASSVYAVDAQRLLYIAKVHAIKTLDMAAINTLFLELDGDATLHSSHAVAAAFFNHIALLYKEAQNPIASYITAVNYYTYDKITWQEVKADRAYSYVFDNKYELLDTQIIGNFMATYGNLKNPTAFEATVLKRLNVQPADFSHDLLGTYYLAQNNLQEAKKHFKKVQNPADFWGSKVRPELFAQSIKEYMNVDFEEYADDIHKTHAAVVGKSWKGVDKENYNDNKLALIEILENLERKAQQNSNQSADYYYMLGNAWYNMSVNGWFLNNLYYIGNNTRNEIRPSPWDDDQRFDAQYQQVLNHSDFYLKKALEVKGSKEIKARVTFALARTNQCCDVTWDERIDDNRLTICGDHQLYFKSLKDTYSDTDYYREILRECSWFME